MLAFFFYSYLKIISLFKFPFKTIFISFLYSVSHVKINTWPNILLREFGLMGLMQDVPFLWDAHTKGTFRYVRMSPPYHYFSIE